VPAWFAGLRRAGGRRERAAVALCRFSDPAWWQVMGFESGPPGTLALVERRFRRLATLAHPDRGGSAEHMQRLIRARHEARRQLSPRR
jgi:hypothetical protein